jgi:hypothetical protein
MTPHATRSFAGRPGDPHAASRTDHDEPTAPAGKGLTTPPPRERGRA